MLFSDSDKPRQLSLDTFSWDANDLSGKFRGCQSSVGFVTRWEKNISGNLSAESGVFSQPMNNPVSGSTTDVNTPVESVASQSVIEPPPDSQLSKPTPQKKRSANPSPLVPASKQARLEQDSPRCSQNFEEEEMDKQIKSMFIGKLCSFCMICTCWEIANIQYSECIVTSYILLLCQTYWHATSLCLFSVE